MHTNIARYACGCYQRRVPELRDPRRAIVVFARTPSEECKAKPIGAARRIEAAYRALLEHTLRVASEVDGADVLLVTSGDVSEARALARTARGATIEILSQRGGSFDERLEFAVEDAFACGYDEVLVIGSDTPEIDAAGLRAGFARLSGGTARAPRAVIGRSTDGGYYLLGLSRFAAAPFREVDFGTARVATQTLEALGRAGFLVSHVDALADIDDVRGLVVAIARLRARADRESILLAAVLAAAIDALEREPVVFSAPVSRPATLRVARGPPRR